MKRVLDLALAGAALVVGGPLLVALSVAVKLDSPGPAFFIQKRIGRGRRTIRVAKLRTMVDRPDGSGPKVTAAHDPRVTRIGRFLRRTKLDELPQLWNVVRGDMSIVGPRPEVPEYVARYRPEWQALFSVRPGLTDLASLTFRDEEQLLALARDRERAYMEVVMPMKLQLALDDVARSSIGNDLAMIARTVRAVIARDDHTKDPVIREAMRRIEELNRT